MAPSHICGTWRRGGRDVLKSAFKVSSHKGRMLVLTGGEVLTM